MLGGGRGEGFPSSDGEEKRSAAARGGGGDGEREEEQRRRWGAGDCSMGVKRLPEVGYGGGDR